MGGGVLGAEWGEAGSGGLEDEVEAGQDNEGLERDSAAGGEGMVERCE